MTSMDVMASVQRIQATFDQLASPATAGTRANSELFAQLVQALSGTTAADATSTTATSGGSATGEALVDEAEKYLGTPYVFGGTTSSGIDCSALMQNAARALGIEIPRVVADQKNAGTPVASLADAQPGDLIVINGGKHVVMYAGDNEVVHAPVPGQVVKREKVWFGDSDVVTIRRIVPEQSAAAATPTISTASAREAALETLQSLISAQSALLTRSVS